MKYNYVFWMMIILTVSLYSQQFTKIMEGDLVNEGGESFGVSWADLNNDGFPDLFVSNGGAAAQDVQNFLYTNNGDGTFSKVTTGNIVTDMKKSIGSTISDYNNDGYEDIFIANRDGENNSLFLNNGDLTFTAVSTGIVVNDGGNSNGSSWADYNNDGFTDLFVANFFASGFLYRNENGNSFTKITSGHPVTEINNSISCSWGDLDNDNDVDLFVPNAASSGKENLLYKNLGNGDFQKVIEGEIITDRRASMGGSWGDFDNDGDLDLFVSNQANFINDLYINNNDGTFTRLDSSEVVSEQSNSICGSWIDFDNDGDLDLFVTNWLNGKNFLYDNSGFPDYSFKKITTGEIVTDEENTMGGAWADYDNDGDLDLFIANRGNENNSLYRNETKGNNWVIIKCVGSISNISAIGTKIRIKSTINGNAYWQMREVNAQSGYNSQNDLRIHFGLGDAVQIDSMIIEWPSSTTELIINVEANKIYQADEGSGISIITSTQGYIQEQPTRFQLYQNYPNPFNPITAISYSIPEAGNVSLKLFDILGNGIGTLLDDEQVAGTYKIEFDATGLASGIYFYKLESGNYISVKKMVVLK